MKELIFATHNHNKVKEVQAVLTNFSIQSLAELGYTQEIEETENSLEGNALLKARCIYEAFKKPVFADDSGLEVDALDGAPGVYSARYAGAEKNHDKNNKKLLASLTEKTNRSAQFRTVIAYTDGINERIFEGVVRGTIAHKCDGNGGFGYDPLFVPDGFKKTFAALPSTEKLRLSHRSKAIAKLKTYLKI